VDFNCFLIVIDKNNQTYTVYKMTISYGGLFQILVSNCRLYIVVFSFILKGNY